MKSPIFALVKRSPPFIPKSLRRKSFTWRSSSRLKYFNFHERFRIVCTKSMAALSASTNGGQGRDAVLPLMGIVCGIGGWFFGQATTFVFLYVKKAAPKVPFVP